MTYHIYKYWEAMQRLTFDDLPLQFDHLMVVHVGNAAYIYLCALLARSTQVIPAYIFSSGRGRICSRLSEAATIMHDVVL